MFVCEDCHINLERTRIGVTVIEMFSQPPRPYKLWDADILRCRRCSRAVIQSAQNAYAEHFEPEFDEALEKALGGIHYYSFERVEDASRYLEESVDEPVPELVSADPAGEGDDA